MNAGKSSRSYGKVSVKKPHVRQVSPGLQVLNIQRIGYRFGNGPQCVVELSGQRCIGRNGGIRPCLFKRIPDEYVPQNPADYWNGNSKYA